jgi:hypothetical protein
MERYKKAIEIIENLYGDMLPKEVLDFHKNIADTKCKNIGKIINGNNSNDNDSDSDDLSTYENRDVL